jgi:hypothetical protein
MLKEARISKQAPGGACLFVLALLKAAEVSPRRAYNLGDYFWSLLSFVLNSPLKGVGSLVTRQSLSAYACHTLPHHRVARHGSRPSPGRQ